MLLPLRASVFLLLLLLNSTIVRSFLLTRRRRTISFPASDVVVALSRRLSAVVHEEEEERRATTSGGSGGWDNAFDLVDDDEGFLRAALSEEFGIHEPNEMQNESIAAAVRGDDTLVIAQTGSGKTMSFLLPILRRLNDDDDDDDKASSSSSRKPVAIVIGPTSELLAQHARVASKLMPSAAVADRVLFKTPEQVLDNDCLRCHDDDENDDDNPLLLENIEIVAIDEVDAVLCGSSDFDDAVPERTMKLLGSLPSSERTQFILTTAHLTRAHARTIRRLFPGIETIRQTGSSQSRVLVPTLRQVFHYFSGDDATAKLEKLRDVLLAVERSSEEEGKKKRQRRRDPTVVFCRDEVEVETVHRFLVSTSTTTTTGNGCAAPLLRDAFAPEKLHAGMPSEERSTALSLFRDGGGDENENDDGGCRMLVTHEIAARGLDFPSVRHVVLFDTPTDVTAFVHRAGRTARAGEEGVVTCLVQAGGGGGGSGGFGSFGEHKDLHALLEAPKLDFAKKKKKKKKPNDDDDDDDDGG